MKFLICNKYETNEIDSFAEFNNYNDINFFEGIDKENKLQGKNNIFPAGNYNNNAISSLNFSNKTSIGPLSDPVILFIFYLVINQ